MKLSNEYRVFDVAGQALMLYTGGKAVDANAAFGLSESAAWLISKVGEQEFTEELLVEWLLEEYDVDEETAAADVMNLLNVLKEHCMVLD